MWAPRSTGATAAAVYGEEGIQTTADLFLLLQKSDLALSTLHTSVNRIVFFSFRGRVECLDELVSPRRPVNGSVRFQVNTH